MSFRVCNKAGMSEKCIEACDELILWFGDGPYVEHALELKDALPAADKPAGEVPPFPSEEGRRFEVTPDDTLEYRRIDQGDCSDSKGKAKS